MRLLPSLVCLLVLSFSSKQAPAASPAQEATPLFQLDPSQFPVGEVTADILNQTGQSGNALVSVPFQLHAKDTHAIASIVELAGKVKALEFKAPALPEGTGPASPKGLYFRDIGLGDHIDSSKPLHLEIQFQRRGIPIHFSLVAFFRPVDNGTDIQAALGMLSPKGTYTAFKTPGKPNGEKEEGPDIPTEQTLTLNYEFIEDAKGVTLKTNILAGKETIFTLPEPATIPGAKLTGFCGMQLMIMHLEEDSGDDAVDLISMKAWQ